MSTVALLEAWVLECKKKFVEATLEHHGWAVRAHLAHAWLDAVRLLKLEIEAREIAGAQSARMCEHGNASTDCEVCHPELESDEDYARRNG